MDLSVPILLAPFFIPGGIYCLVWFRCDSYNDIPKSSQFENELGAEGPLSVIRSIVVKGGNFVASFVTLGDGGGSRSSGSCGDRQRYGRGLGRRWGRGLGGGRDYGCRHVMLSEWKRLNYSELRSHNLLKAVEHVQCDDSAFGNKKLYICF